MPNPIESALSFGDIIRALKHHRRKAIVTACTILALTVIALLLWPRTYRSEGKLFVTLGRQSVALDPTATTGQVVSVSESREIQINSIIEMLSSRAMAEKVVDRIGVDVISARAPLPEESTKLPEDFAATPSASRELAVTELEKTINASAPRLSTVVSVECTAKTPELAQRIVAVLMDEYRAEHVRVHGTTGSRDFFDKQAKLLQKSLDVANEKLRDEKNQLGIASIAGKKKMLEAQIAAVEQQIINTDTALASAKSKVTALEEKMESIPDRIVTQHITGVANIGADNTKSQLFQLQIKERELLSKFTEVHPLVVAIREQVKQAQQLQRDMEPAPGQSTMAVNPAHQQLEIAKLTEQANIESLNAQARKLQEKRTQIQEQLRELNFAEIRINQLQRGSDLAESNLTSYMDKLEQARIDEAMQGNRISNVNIMQPANYVTKPASPQKALILFAGLVLAVIGAYATVMTAEFIDHSLYSRDEIEQHLDLPVLVTIPQVSRQVG